jgi:hypothetical protein
MFSSSFFYNAKDWLIEHQRNLLLLVGFVAVGALMFESGYLRGQTLQSAPLVISIPATSEPQTESSILDSVQSGGDTKPAAVLASGAQSTEKCPLVGSRNSNKYHAATCAVVKRIKLENRVCFASKEEAEKRGYVVGCLK